MAWTSLSDRENWIGRYDLAIAAGRRALALQTDEERPYAVLARALLHAGLFDQASSVCAQGVARHVDGDDLHSLLFQIADARRNDAGMAKEMQWARANSAEVTLLIDALQVSFSRGQVRQALEQSARALALRKGNGMNNLFASPDARILYDLGFTQMAKDSLSRRPPGEPSTDGLFAIAEMGDPHQAESLIRSQVKTRPSDTLLNAMAAPQALAALALRSGKPLEAVGDLRVAGPYERIDQAVPYLRGRAYLAALDGPRAAREFHKILDHPGPDILALEYPLARLGLARALRLEHNIPAARAAYQQFLSDWKDADPDVPVLVEAQAEYAALPR
jgi:tetratricopeptide (TPR) repeat protein